MGLVLKNKQLRNTTRQTASQTIPAGFATNQVFEYYHR